MPENVVEALVGEAFNRLDPPAQRIMEALAIYTVPVPPVAVDYLVQPYQPTIDSAPVLSRLVNMQFVRRDAGRYYLHQVDRDYALRRVPVGETAGIESRPFTQSALHERAADYFQQVRTPRETWRSIDDLAPQLAEFDQRYQAGDFDTAAQVLLDIDFDYLQTWGHYRLVLDLHQRLHGQLSDPWYISGSKTNVGNCYRDLGETWQAIELFEQALDIDRGIGSREGEAANLGNLGGCYTTLGELRRAIELHEQSLAIEREIGHREGEAADLGNLGGCYAALGETRRAIEHVEQALAIEREIGRREGEATSLSNLGFCYAALGETRRGIEHLEQALVISRDVGSRPGESLAVDNLGNAYADVGAWEQAVSYCEQAVRIADQIELLQGRAENRLSLAAVHLLMGELDAARRTAEAARAYHYAPVTAAVAFLLGAAFLREGNDDAAKRAFSDALHEADALLAQTADNFSALDTKALALCGLALLDDPARSTEASATFRAARAITRAEGIVARTLRLFDALAPRDEHRILEPIRRVAAGDA